MHIINDGYLEREAETYIRLKKNANNCVFYLKCMRRHPVVSP